MYTKHNPYELKCIAHCTMCFAQKHMPYALSSHPPRQDLPDADNVGLVNSQGASSPIYYNPGYCPRAFADSGLGDIRARDLLKCSYSRATNSLTLSLSILRHPPSAHPIVTTDGLLQLPFIFGKIIF